MSYQSVSDLLGENLSDGLGLGEDMTGNLISGYIPERTVEFSPLTQIGDGLAGAPNEQHLQIFRDDRPIATDELGVNGPFVIEWRKLAHHSAGRSFPLNYGWTAGLDQTNPGLLPRNPDSSLYPSPLYWGQDPDSFGGMAPVEVLPAAHTVYYTASPNVGWQPGVPS